MIDYSKTLKVSKKGIQPCLTCSELFDNISGQKRYCSKECLPNYTKQCRYCNIDFNTKTSHKLFCSSICQKKSAAKDFNKNKALEEGLIKCLICNESHKQLASHLKNKHSMSTFEYLERFPNAETVCEKTSKIMSDKVSGEKNAWFNHNGKLSPFSKNNSSISEEKRLQNQQNAIKTMLENENNNATLAYYLKHTEGDIEKAESLLKNRQTTFSLEKCILKYGEEDGKKRWAARQALWLKNYKKSNYSKISQVLFKELLLRDESLSDSIFANRFSENNNDEFVLKTLDKAIKPDFFNERLKAVIEFDGDYWHSKGDSQANKYREAIRDKAIIQMGYKVFHVQENHFHKQREEAIQECLNFLNQK